MAQQSDNPFRSMTVRCLKTQQSDYDEYCQAGQKSRPDRSPFPRKVDLWFAGLSLAARKKLVKPADLEKLKKNEMADIISGDIFNTDGWQAQAIMLIAISFEENLKVVLNPRRMMDIANGLASAGVPYIVKMLNEGAESPIWNLSEAFEKLLQSGTVTEEQSIQDQLAEALDDL